MDQQWIFVIDFNYSVHIKPAKNFAQMQAQEFLSNLGFDNTKYILKIQTPLYSEIIPSDTQVLKRHPYLLLSKRPDQYERPLFFLTIGPIPNKPIISFFVETETTNMIEIPPFRVDFHLDENQTGKEIIEKIDKSIDLPHTDGSCPSINLNDTSQTIFSNAKKNGIIFKCTLTTESLHIITQRQKIIDEIIQTESTYVNNLSNIINNWQVKIKKSNVFTDIEFNKVFKDFPAIYKCHSLFLDNLQSKNISYSTIVSDAFLEFSDFFKVSLPYISNYPSLIQLITPKMHNNISTFQCKDSLPFSSYLILPIQRMPRYLLFIRELIKYTPKSHPDSPLLELALTKIEKVTIEMDIAAKNAQKINEVLMLQQRLTKNFQLVEASRFIKRVTNVKYRNKNCKFYLFNDLITINQYDKKTETILYSKKIIDFKYFPLVNSFSIYDNIHKLHKTYFQNSSEFTSIITQIEQIRKEIYLRNHPNLNSVFIFTNPIMLRKLSNIKETHSLTHDNIFYFFTQNKLITLDPYKSSISINDFKQQRFGYSLCKHNETFYLIGGYNHKEYFNDIYKYDINTKQFIKVVPLNSVIFEQRCEHTSICYNNNIYIFGGRNKEKYLNSLICYSINENKFIELKTNDHILPKNRAQHSAILKLYLMIIYGGKNNRQIFNDVWSFDLIHLKWIQLNNNINIPKRFGHNTIIINKYIISIGGTCDGVTNVSPTIFMINGKNVQNVQHFESFGNFPNLMLNFGMCIDTENKLIVLYNSSFFIITLPKIIIEEIELTTKKRSGTIKDNKIHHIMMENMKFSKDTNATLKLPKHTRQTSAIHYFDMIRSEDKNDEISIENDENSSETLNSELSETEINSKIEKKRKNTLILPHKTDETLAPNIVHRKSTLQPQKHNSVDQNAIIQPRKKVSRYSHKLRNANRFDINELKTENSSSSTIRSFKSSGEEEETCSSVTSEKSKKSKKIRKVKKVKKKKSRKNKKLETIINEINTPNKNAMLIKKYPPPLNKKLREKHLTSRNKFNQLTPNKNIPLSPLSRMISRSERTLKQIEDEGNDSFASLSPTKAIASSTNNLKNIKKKILFDI